jgi:acetyl esterase/lipase
MLSSREAAAIVIAMTLLVEVVAIPRPVTVIESAAVGPQPSVPAAVATASLLGVTVRIGIAYSPPVRCSRSGAKCVLRYDLYRPAGPGPFPIVVMAPGGPTSPTGGGRLAAFARGVAARGAVVMVANWRQGDRYGGRPPIAVGDIGCAIRTARSIAPAVHGDLRRIVLLGHSLGGWGSAIEMLDATASTPALGSCLRRTGSTRPAAFIGIAGAYAGPAGDFDDVDWSDLLGVRLSADAAFWARFNPLVVAARSRSAHVPVLLIYGSADRTVAPTQTKRFATRLRAANRAPRVVMEPGMGHTTVLTTATTFREVFALIRRLPSS